MKQKPAKNRMTEEKIRQSKWAFWMLLGTAIGWIFLCFTGIPQQSFLYISLSFAIIFITVLTAWIVLLLGLCHFPEPEGCTHLYHSTPSWSVIKESSCLFPTADGQVYFTERPEKLGQKSRDGTDTMLVFKDAKVRRVAEPAKFRPYQYQRFKTGRGEWLAAPFFRVVIEDYQEVDSGKSVNVESYRLEKVAGASCKLLQVRRAAAAVLLSPVLISALLAALITESTLRKVSFWRLGGFWIVISLVGVLAIAYMLQSRLNAYIFRNR